MSRVAAATGALVLCLPLLVGALVVSGGGGSVLPLVLALAVTAFAAAAAIQARLRSYAAAAALSLALVLASAGVDETTVETEAELHAARFGLPLGFVEAELSATPPLPYDATWDPWEDPARLRVAAFGVSSAIVFAALAGTVFLARRLTRRRRTGRMTDHDDDGRNGWRTLPTSPHS